MDQLTTRGRTIRGIKRIATVAVLIALATTMQLTAQGQFDPNSLRTKKDEQTFQSPDVNSLMSSSSKMLTAMDGPIDPDIYVVGPTDIFYVAVWGPVPVAFTVPITPEGTLILPTIGEANVANLTLSEMKAVVTEQIRKSYKIGSISVSLLQARQLKVVLRGAVPRPGQYIASSTDRIDYVVRQGAETKLYQPSLAIPATAMSSITKDKLELPEFKDLGKFDKRSAVRNIIVVHKNGDTAFADLPKYYATGDSKYNPHLVDGDVIIVPEKDLSRRYVSVHGAVNSPGVFEFVPGDRLQDIIAIADGLRPDRATDIAVITARGGSDTEVNLSSGANPELTNGARIFVDPDMESAASYTVDIDGEVLGPGSYPIVPGKTTLKEIVGIAGGLTRYALPSGSGVYRKKHVLGEDASSFLEIKEAIRNYPFVPSDSAFFLLNTKVGIDPVNVNMYKLFVEKKNDFDITLQDGDYIYIARDRQSVLIQGQVRFPGYVPLMPGANYEYYIEKAGGFTEYADEGGTRLVKMATQSWLEPDEDDVEIESGDIIWIPKDPVRDFTYYLSIIKDVGVLLGSLVTIGLIIVQIQQISKN